MATVKTARAFTHLDIVAKKGQQFPADHWLVQRAPHLFVVPEPDPQDDPPVTSKRVRGPLVNPPTTSKDSD